MGVNDEVRILELPPQAEDGNDGQTLLCEFLGVVVVVLNVLYVGLVVDILDVQVGVQHPRVVDPAFVDADVQLMKAVNACRVYTARNRTILVGVGVENGAGDWRVKIAGEVPKACAYLPVLGQTV